MLFDRPLDLADQVSILSLGEFVHRVFTVINIFIYFTGTSYSTTMTASNRSPMVLIVSPSSLLM
jgi:hypothetical protein